MKRLIAALLLGAFSAGACAQGAKPAVRMISGYPPGGNVDILARLFAEKLAESIGRPVVVVNRPGAGGQIGLEALKASQPDGNTLIVTPDASLVIRPLVMKVPPYDPINDFAAVANAGAQDYAVAINAAIPAKDLKEFAAWAKANPTRANFGAGQGGATHFIGILTGQAIGVPLQAIPYNGSGPAVLALVSGEVSATVQPLGTLIAQARAGKIRLIASTGAERAAAAKDVATMAEQGHAALTASNWFGVFAPAKTPIDVVAQLNGIFVKAMRGDSGLREKLQGLGLEPSSMTPAQLAALVKADLERWTPVIRASGFSMD